MAEKRMFSKKIVDSDAFLDMPPEVRLLYFELGMRCDDDGFCAGPQRILRMTGAGERALQRLISDGFLLQFDGIVVVKHWRSNNNAMKNDRLTGPNYPEIAEKLYLKPSGVYTLDAAQGVMTLSEYKRQYCETRSNPLRIPNGSDLESQKRGEEKRIEENRKEENRRSESSAEEGPESADSEEHGGGEKEELTPLGGTLGQGVLLLTDRQMDDLLRKMPLQEFDRYTKRLSDYILEHDARVRNHYGTILKWWREDHALEPP